MTNNTINFTLLITFKDEQHISVLETPNEESIKEKYMQIKKYLG